MYFFLLLLFFHNNEIFINLIFFLFSPLMFAMIIVFFSVFFGEGNDLHKKLVKKTIFFLFSFFRYLIFFFSTLSYSFLVVEFAHGDQNFFLPPLDLSHSYSIQYFILFSSPDYNSHIERIFFSFNFIFLFTLGTQTLVLNIKFLLSSNMFTFHFYSLLSQFILFL